MHRLNPKLRLIPLSYHFPTKFFLDRVDSPASKSVFQPITPGIKTLLLRNWNMNRKLWALALSALALPQPLLAQEKDDRPSRRGENRDRDA